MDMRLEKGEEAFLPKVPVENAAFLFYVFNGQIQVNENIHLTIGESVLIEKENPVFTALQTSDIVLLITQTNAPSF
jgi:hypothetical protein